jgi:hypothetical protein
MKIKTYKSDSIGIISAGEFGTIVTVLETIIGIYIFQTSCLAFEYFKVTIEG